MQIASLSYNEHILPSVCRAEKWFFQPEKKTRCNLTSFRRINFSFFLKSGTISIWVWGSTVVYRSFCNRKSSTARRFSQRQTFNHLAFSLSFIRLSASNCLSDLSISHKIQAIRNGEQVFIHFLISHTAFSIFTLGMTQLHLYHGVQHTVNVYAFER